MSQNSSLKEKYLGLSLKKRIGLAVLLPVWVFVSFMAVQLLAGAAIAGLVAAGVSFDGINSSIVGTTLSAIVYVLVIALVIGGPWLVLKRPTTLQEVGLYRLPRWKDLGIAPIGFVGYLLLTTLIMAAAQAVLVFVDFDQQQVTGFEGLSQNYEYALAFLTLVIIAPIAEEVLFRGYLFGKLRKVAPVWVAILITSVLFGIVHLAWNVGIDVFALSVVMCLVTIWSKSLWPAIIIHMAKNFIAFYFLFINPTLLTTIGG